MKVCLDATALMCPLDTRLNEFPAPDGSVVGLMQRRMDHLVATIDRAKGSVIVPTPALAELLVRNLSTTLRHRRLRFTEQSLLLWMWMWQVG